MTTRSLAGALMVLLAIASACYDASERPQTGGHTNWLKCRSLDDCAQSADAVECKAGYCLDGDGDRIARPDGGEPAPSNDAGDAADGGDPCRSQCPLNVDGDNCVEQPIESFPELAATLEEWSATKCTGDAADAFPYLLEARCEDATRVLYYGSGGSIERRYYDGSGQFLALETAGDGGQGPRCNGSAYWPVRVACENAVATNVVCGTATFMVGDPVPL